MTNNRPTRALINSQAMAHNLNIVRQLAGDAKVMAVVKADGYGHGMETVAKALKSADEFAVNGMDDANRLRSAGINKPLTLLCDPLSTSQLNKLSHQNIRPTLFDINQLDDYLGMQHDASLSIWLKVDTGMSRLGVLPEQVADVMSRLQQAQGIKEVSLMTHLANADDVNHPLNQQQIRLFKQMAEQFSFKQKSILNSAGVISLSESAHQQIEGDIFVRPGVMLYGASPMLGMVGKQHELKLAMEFRSKLISIKDLKAGSTIGYGSTYVLKKQTKVGVIACGYGDGYPRHAPTGTPVLVNGQPAPLIGRVSMDMITVDLTGIDTKLGDEVILWGEDNPIEHVAAQADTIAYELMCGILPRVQKELV